MTFKEWWRSLPIIKQLCPVAVARAAWEAATLSKRERCAKVCEEMFGKDGAIWRLEHNAAMECAEAIRKGE